MNLKVLLVTLLLFVASAFAQTIRIDAPSLGQTLQPGQPFKAKLTLLPYISSLRQVAIVIALRHCLATPCNPDSALDYILYQGPYNPTSHGGSLSYQTFPLTAPGGQSAGEAMLNVAHFYLVGAENIPELNVTGITVNIG